MLLLLMMLSLLFERSEFLIAKREHYSYTSNWYQVYISGVNKAQKKTIKEPRPRNVVVVDDVIVVIRAKRVSNCYMQEKKN